MNVVRFDPRKGRMPPPSPKRDVVTPIVAVVALVAVCALGWVLADHFPSTGPVTITGSSPTIEVTASFSTCGRNRHTCVVDGDTIWWRGKNLRLQSYDTPEPHDGICGGRAEVALANRASARLLQILNTNPFT